MEYLKKPWDHQLRTIIKASPRNNHAIFFDIGCGKTSTAINILRHWWSAAGGIGPTLIFCPPIVRRNWKKEFGMHSKLASMRIIVLDGSGKKRIEMMQDNLDAWVFITNYESLLMPDLFTEFKKLKPKYIIWDESHKIKSPTSKRSKKAAELSNPHLRKVGRYIEEIEGAFQPKKLLLTGTPILKDVMDLFQQFLVMDGGKSFGYNFYVFRVKYFYDANAGKRAAGVRTFPLWIPHKGSEAEINRILKENCSHAIKEECLDIPPLTKKVLSCRMGVDQARMYKELAKDFVTYMNKDIVSADLAIVKGLRLMQLVAGFYTTIDGKTVVYNDNPKLKELEELLVTHTPKHKILLWMVWKPNYIMIADLCKRLNIPYVEIHGGISDKKKKIAEDRFNDDESFRVLIGHPASGGIGINLISSDLTVFYSRNFSLEQKLQAGGRNHRGGQTKKVTQIDLVCEGTIDELIEASLANKVKISVAVLKGIAEQL